MINNNSSSLNDVLNGLKYKYVELQEKNKQDLKVYTDNKIFDNFLFKIFQINIFFIKHIYIYIISIINILIYTIIYIIIIYNHYLKLLYYIYRNWKMKQKGLKVKMLKRI